MAENCPLSKTMVGITLDWAAGSNDAVAEAVSFFQQQERPLIEVGEPALFFPASGCFGGKSA